MVVHACCLASDLGAAYVLDFADSRRMRQMQPVRHMLAVKIPSMHTVVFPVYTLQYRQVEGRCRKEQQHQGYQPW